MDHTHNNVLDQVPRATNGDGHSLIDHPAAARVTRSDDDVALRTWCQRQEFVVIRTMPDGSFMVTCPSHADRKPSLHISRGEHSRILLHCHAGCEHTDVLAALGLREQNLFHDLAAIEEELGLPVWA